MKAFYGEEPPIQFETLKHHFIAERAFFYDAIDYRRRPTETEKGRAIRIRGRKAFLNAINNLEGFHVRTGHVRPTKKLKPEQKGVDVLLAIEAIEHAARGNMTHAIFVTGDSDFAPLLAALIRFGIHTQVACCARSASRRLLRGADKVHLLTLTQFWHWSPQSFRDTHEQVQIIAGAQPVDGLHHVLERKGFITMRSGGKVIRTSRSVTLHRSLDSLPTFSLYVESGVGIREHSVLFEYSDPEKMIVAVQHTVGHIDWIE